MIGQGALPRAGESDSRKGNRCLTEESGGRRGGNVDTFHYGVNGCGNVDTFHYGKPSDEPVAFMPK